MKTRFDLEQSLLAVWGTAEDINALYEHFSYTEKIDHDELANALLGLYTLHNIKSQRAFELFEEMIKEGNIK